MTRSNQSRRVLFRAACLGSALWAGLIQLLAQSPLAVYTDNLVNGFQDWGWASRDYANPSPLHSGTASVAVTIPAPWQGLQVYHPDIVSSRW